MKIIRSQQIIVKGKTIGINGFQIRRMMFRKCSIRKQNCIYHPVALTKS
jgi:hypothetical protein